MQLGLVHVVASDLFTSTSDPPSFYAYKILSVGFVVGEEESVSNGADFLVKGFYRYAGVSD